MSRILIAIVLLISTQSAPAQHRDSTEAPFASLIQLIANPSAFDGKRVIVLGFLDMEREGDLLFTSRDTYDNVIMTDALWIDRTEDMGKTRAMLNRKYVRIEGTFRAGSQGHIKFVGGGVNDISRCTPWSDASNPARDRLHDMLTPKGPKD